MRPSRVSLAGAVALALMLCASLASAAPIAHLTLTSEAGDFVGQGSSFDITYTPANSDFFLVSVFPFPPVPSFLDFALGTITGGPDDTFATLSFSTTQIGIAIAPGSYPEAERALFASPGHPGLDVTFQNRGCAAVTGGFTVHEATFSPDGLTINTFSAAFEQHCDDPAAPALVGTFTFQADPAIPEPRLGALIASGLLTFVCYLRGRR